MAFVAGSRRKRSTPKSIVIPLFIGMLAVLSLLLFLYNFVWSSGSHQAEETIRQFYEYEQKGDYGSAWELFHSQMKARFPKEQYIQQRAQVMMQQLGARTFTFTMGKVEHISAWQMAEETPALQDVYTLAVTEKLMSVFGIMTIQQQVYAAKENGVYTLLWPFSERR